jgi:hypothetical protein
MENIVYLYCHQQTSNQGPTLVLVADDGVQHPPIIFPIGSQLFHFLTCLETALAPNYLIEPTSWQDLINSDNLSIILRKSQNFKNTNLNSSEDVNNRTNMSMSQSFLDITSPLYASETTSHNISETSLDLSLTPIIKKDSPKESSIEPMKRY